jgi:sugar O-acyltransferase (sialic acid O-acetyltransferase NeuD family)
MAKVVIFGIIDTAELAHYYLTHDSPHEVVAFTVNQEYIKEPYFHGLPVVAYEEITNIYPPDDFKMFVPMTGRKMNTLREKIYNSAKSMGYELISYVSSKATLFNNEIGDNCFILEDNTLQPFTKIGNNVVLWSGNHIGHHGIINDHVFFTSHVVMSGHCNIGSYSFFGVNSTLRDGSIIAPGTLVGMSASITKNTQEWGIYIGNPAKLLEGKKSIDIY